MVSDAIDMEGAYVDLTDKRVFLSGPITGKPDNNRDAFVSAEGACYEAGASYVFNPCTHWGHSDRPREWYMRHDLNWLTVSAATASGEEPAFDVMVQLEGWAASDGARVEHQVACACGIPCVSVEEVG